MSNFRPSAPQGEDDGRAILPSGRGRRLQIDSGDSPADHNIARPQWNWINGPNNMVNGANNLVFDKGG